LALPATKTEDWEFSRIHFPLKDRTDVALPHLGRYAFKNEGDAQFVAELAGFLGVPVVKAAPGGFQDPFLADLARLGSDIARLLHLPGAKTTPGGSMKPFADFDDW
jgi:hypothetical protein